MPPTLSKFVDRVLVWLPEPTTGAHHGHLTADVTFTDPVAYKVEASESGRLVRIESSYIRPPRFCGRVERTP
jgi:hypothetical protein